MTHCNNSLSIIEGGGVAHSCRSFRAKFLAQFLVFFFTSFLFIPHSFADCVNPAGVEGQQVFNSTYKTMQFCDGTTWFGMKGGGGGSVVDTAGCLDGQSPAYDSSSSSFRCFDLIPDAYSFVDQSDVLEATLIESNIVQISGIDGPANVSVGGDDAPVFRVCADATCSASPTYTSLTQTIYNDNYLQLRQLSNAIGGVTNSLQVNIGGVLDQWSVTTILDQTPDVFSFTDQTEVAQSTLISSNILQITGVNVPLSIGISGDGSPKYRICSDSTCSSNPNFTSISGTVNAGDYVQLSLTSGGPPKASSSALLAVGSASDTWQVDTTISFGADGGDYQTAKIFNSGKGLQFIATGGHSLTLPATAGGTIAAKLYLIGGGGDSGSTLSCSNQGGGGGGGFAYKSVNLPTGVPITINVGAGGANGPGGTSSLVVDAINVSATGGAMSGDNTNAPGGTGIGGDINYTGGNGGKDGGDNAHGGGGGGGGGQGSGLNGYDAAGPEHHPGGGGGGGANWDTGGGGGGGSGCGGGPSAGVNGGGNGGNGSCGIHTDGTKGVDVSTILYGGTTGKSGPARGGLYGGGASGGWCGSDGGAQGIVVIDFTP